jgi:hypothetical protein
VRRFEDAAQLRLAIRHPNGSGSGSALSTIALCQKAAKLMKLCDIEGIFGFDDLLQAAVTASVCPAICMTEGCEYTTEMEPDQDQGFCEVCGGNTVTSALVLAIADAITNGAMLEQGQWR